MPMRVHDTPGMLALNANRYCARQNNRVGLHERFSSERFAGGSFKRFECRTAQCAFLREAKCIRRLSWAIPVICPADRDRLFLLRRFDVIA